MGFDYYIRIECAVQKPRKDQDFVQRAKIGAYAAQMKAVAEQSPTPPKTLVTPFPIKTLMGARTEIAIPELVETWERVERKTLPFCRDCSANFDGGAFGCWGSINYPISPEAERWLIDHLRSPSPGGSYLVHHIKESGVDGRRLDEQRAEFSRHPDGGGMIPLLLPPGPAEKVIEDARITSSMIIDYLLVCQPQLIPMTLLGLLDDFGAIEIDETAKMMMHAGLFMGQSELAESSLSEMRFVLAEDPSDDRSISQIKTFLHACYVALKQNGRMMIDG